MMSIARLKSIVCVLLCLHPLAFIRPALASDSQLWHGEIRDRKAYLSYPTELDREPYFSFVCDHATGSIAFERSSDARFDTASTKHRLVLSSGTMSLSLLLEPVGPQHDHIQRLRAPLPSSSAVNQLLTSGDVLEVNDDGIVEKVPLTGALAAAQPMLRVCDDATPDPELALTDSCDIWAWVTDTDPDGLAVRKGPSLSEPVIGNLPPSVEVEDYTFRTEVAVTGSRDGWFRISSGTVPDYFGETDGRSVFEGEGWVQGSHLGLLMNDAKVYGEPRAGSVPLAEWRNLAGDTTVGAVGADSFTVDQLFACRGSWVELQASYGEIRQKGWVTGTCANQVTTCP